MTYRSDIDGIRAISILAVVWYHAFPASVPGGFVGVDIFFVISGFLITRIIVGQLADHSFSLLEFYRRRIRRIFPALIVVLFATYIAGWALLLPRDFQLLGDNILGGAGFFANLLQIGGQGYFAPDASGNPLLHLWSLGIEEQFYIFWPLLLMLTPGGRRNAVIIAIALASLAANLLLVRDHQAVAFYSPATRAWELLAGALLAGSASSRSGGLPAEIKGAAGLVLAVAASFLLRDSSDYPGWAALMPVGAAVLLLDAPGSIVNRRILSNPAMVLVGRVSYPLYLWHWPLLCYLQIARDGVANLLEKDVAVGLAFVLACGTTYLIERPIQQRRTSAGGLASAMVAIGAIGLITVFGQGFAFRFPAEVSDIASLPSKDNTGFRADCFSEMDTVPAERRTRCIERGDGPLLFIWGDSTAAALYPGLRAMQPFHLFRIAQFTAAACTPAVSAAAGSQCGKLNDDTLQVIADTRPDIVLLHAMWNEKTDLLALRQTVSKLREVGIPRIVILGPVPVWKRTPPFRLVNAYRFQHQLPDRIADGVLGAEADSIMARFSRDAGVEYISAWQRFCNPQGCLTRTGPAAQDIVAWDQVHLTNKGSEFLARAMIGDLLDR